MGWIWLSFIYGIALAMDCLALSITDGLCFQNIKKRKYFFIAGVFALGQFLFPLVGHFVGLLGQTYFTEWFDTYDHWIAFVLLCFIGGKMLYEGIKGMGLNYLSKQTHRAEDETIFLCDDKEFFRPYRIFSKEKTMFNYDHLLNQVTHHELPFDYDVFDKNLCKFYAVSTSCLDGKAYYLEKSDLDFLPDAIAASSALPLTSKPVLYHGPLRSNKTRYHLAESPGAIH